MLNTLATWLVGLTGVYMLVGLLFGVAFLVRGVGRIDPVARQGTWGFRMIIAPGVIALWPLLARRWLGGTASPPAERTAHKLTAGVAAPPGEAAA